MPKIILKNESGTEVTVRESNAGVPRKLTILKPGDHFALKYDKNATYREYIFVCAGPEELKVVSSDDFAQFKEIKIFQSPETKHYDWVGIERDGAKDKAQELANTSSTSIWSRILRKVGL